MTEVQAHQFVARWSRILRIKDADDIQRHRNLKANFWVLFAGNAFLFSVSVMQNVDELSASHLLMTFLALIFGGFLLWMILRLNEARQVLFKTIIENRESKIQNG